MIDIRHDLLLNSAIASKLVGHQDPRIAAVSRNQLLQKMPGCILVAPFLHQDVKNVAMLIDSAPRIEDLALHLDHDLVQEPFLAELGPIAPDDVSE